MATSNNGNVNGQVADLERRLAKLEDQMQRVLALLPPDRGHLSHLLLTYAGASSEQEKMIYTLLDQVREKLREGNAPSLAEFERSVYDILPNLRGNHPFVKSLLLNLGEDRDYTEIYAHYQQAANIPALSN
jgi:hypothetical protein